MNCLSVVMLVGLICGCSTNPTPDPVFVRYSDLAKDMVIDCVDVESCYKAMHIEISRNFEIPQGIRGVIAVDVNVELGEGAEVLSVEVIGGSPNDRCVDATLKAIRDSSPFTFLLNLPESEFNKNFRSFRTMFLPGSMRSKHNKEGQQTPAAQLP